jgi:hypothetical protein
LRFNKFLPTQELFCFISTTVQMGPPETFLDAKVKKYVRHQGETMELSGSASLGSTPLTTTHHNAPQRTTAPLLSD